MYVYIRIYILDATPRLSAYFGQGVGMILRQYLRCSGSESRLVDCPESSSTCSHIEDAGVTCLPTSELSITNINDDVDIVLWLSSQPFCYETLYHILLSSCIKMHVVKGCQYRTFYAWIAEIEAETDNSWCFNHRDELDSTEYSFQTVVAHYEHTACMERKLALFIHGITCM